MTVELFLGIAFIVVIAASKFRRWPPNVENRLELPPRSYTSLTRFNFFMTCYIACHAAVFLFVVFCPDLIKKIFTELQPQSPIPKMLKNIFSDDIATRSLAAAFVLTGVVPSIPALKRMDHALRYKLHSYAQIPWQALAVIRQLQKSKTFCPDGDVCIKVCEELRKRTGCKVDFFFGKNELLNRLGKVAYFDECLFKWGETPSNNKCMSGFSPLCSRFKTEFEYCLAELKAIHSQNPENIPTEDSHKDLYRRVNTALKMAYTIICCGIYRTKSSRTYYVSEYERFGLYPKFKPILPFELDSIIVTGFWLFIITLVAITSIILAHNFSGMETFFFPKVFDAVGWAVASFLLHGLSIFTISAILTGRSHYHAAHGEESLGTKGYRATWTGIGFIVGTMVGLMLLGICLILLSQGDMRSVALWWALMPGCSGAFIAWHILTAVNRKKPLKRLKTGGTGAAIFFFAALLVTSLVVESRMHEEDHNKTTLIEKYEAMNNAAAYFVIDRKVEYEIISKLDSVLHHTVGYDVAVNQTLANFLHLYQQATQDMLTHLKNYSRKDTNFAAFNNQTHPISVSADQIISKHGIKRRWWSLWLAESGILTLMVATLNGFIIGWVFPRRYHERLQKHLAALG